MNETKVRITCPECGKYHITKINKKEPVKWTHECGSHYFLVKIEVKLE